MTEAWVKENIYCPRCANQKLAQFPNNAIVADFYCEKCGSEFELKSKKGILGKKIADGAYETFCSRITSYKNPDFFILSYSSLDLCVENLSLLRLLLRKGSLYLLRQKELDGSAAMFYWRRSLGRAEFV